MSVFVTPRFALTLAVGAVPASVLAAFEVSPWGAIIGWVTACAAGVAIDASAAADAHKVTVSRRVPPQAMRGDPLAGSLVLQNTNPRRLRGLVRDAWPSHARARFDGGPGAQGAAQPAEWGRIDMLPGERLRVPMMLTPKRPGEVRSGSVVVRSLGPLGLAGRQTHHTLPGAVRVIRGPWKKSRSLPAAPEPGDLLAETLQGEDGGIITTAIAELRDLAAVYGSRAHLETGGAHPVVEAVYEGITRGGRDSAFPDHSAGILPLTDHVTDLFVRVRQRGTEQEMRLLISRYRDTLAKLTMAFSSDYYGDILRNPQYWSNAEERKREVRLAVEEVDRQAVENIKQVNESRDLEFKVALDSLTRTVNEAKLSDVYSDREN